MPNEPQILRVTSPDGEIVYTLVRKKVKNINLRVRMDGTVAVSAPPRAPQNTISAFVQSQSSFIHSAQQKFSQRDAESPQEKSYVSGEHLRIWGRNLELNVVVGQPESVVNDGEYITLTVRDGSDWAKKNRLMQRYLEEIFRAECARLVAETTPKFEKYGVCTPELKLRDMKTRWGTCHTRKGIITLNKRLLAFDRDCLDYVVMHEFCHFLHPNHSKQFYDCLAGFMPDWQVRKRKLRMQES